MASQFFQDGFWKQWIPGYNIYDMIEGFTKGQYRTGIGQIDFNDFGIKSGSTNKAAGPLDNYDSWNGDLTGYLQYKAQNGTDSDYDRFMNFLENNYSINKANEWTASREDTQYQRLVADLKAAGINPYVLLSSGGSPIASSSANNGYSGAYSSNEALKKETNSQKWLSLLTSIITTVIMAAAIAA